VANRDHIHELPVCGFGAHNPHDPSCAELHGREIACGEIVDPNNPNVGKALCRHKEGCFIATAAYGSEIAPPVQFLREFRDDVVLKSRFKKLFNVFLNFYYSFSPRIAEIMEQNKPVRLVMKYVVVVPFVFVSVACAFVLKTFQKK
jgi:hypothetical protein